MKAIRKIAGLAWLIPTLALAGCLAYAAWAREEPTVYRSTWCPPPADREAIPGPITRDAVTVHRATAPRLVIARLREIRADLERLAEEEPGPLESVDRKLRDLISDLTLDVAEEPRQP